MLNVFSTTLPIFLLLALGFSAAHFRIMALEDIRALGVFVFRFALPALVYAHLSACSVAQIFNLDYLAVYAAASLSVFLLVFLAAKYIFGCGMAESAIQALGSSVSNSGFIGYPIAVLALGPPAAVALALGMIVENALMIPLGLTLAESGNPGAETGGKGMAQLAQRLLKNPLILAILAGALASLCRLRLPEALLRPVEMLAAASAPAALLAVGGTLAGLQIKGSTGDITRMVLAKLILHPLAVILMLCLVPSLDPVMKKAMVIFASAPMLSILAILGRPYGQEQIGAAALMVATTLSFFTISLLLLIIEGRAPF